MMTEEPLEPLAASSSSDKLFLRLSMRYQAFLDKVNPYRKLRWVVLFSLVALFLFRVLYFQGWYIVCYGLFIYLLNLLILFLSPQIDPEEEEFFSNHDEESLPTTIPSSLTYKTGADDEYRPFIRRLFEFSFWVSMTKAVLIALFFTSSRVFDIKVYWPILLVYFITLFIVTMRKRIAHMIKFRYLPFDIGKKSYDKKNKQYGMPSTSSGSPVVGGIGQNIFQPYVGPNVSLNGRDSKSQ